MTISPSAPPPPGLSRYLHHVAMQTGYAEMGTEASKLATVLAHVLAATFAELAAECRRRPRAYDDISLAHLVEDWIGGVGHDRAPPFVD